MPIFDKAKDILGAFLEGQGKKLRLRVETNIEKHSTRQDSPDNKQRLKFIDKQKSKQVTKDRSIDNSQSSVRIDSLNIGTLNILMTDTDTPLSEQDIPDSLKQLYDAFNQDKNITFVAESDQKRLNNVLAFEKEAAVASQLTYFKNRLSPRDYSLMRTGFYLRHLKQYSPHSVQSEWSKIQSNTDRSERRIINLASAGYFESYFKPLAIAYDKDGKTKQDFRRQFEDIIEDMHFVVFVGSQMGVGSVIGEVKRKARKNIRYRVSDEIIYIHATGHGNIRTAREAVTDLRKLFKRVVKASLPQHIKDNAVRYKVYYKETLVDLNGE